MIRYFSAHNLDKIPSSENCRNKLILSLISHQNFWLKMAETCWFGAWYFTDKYLQVQGENSWNNPDLSKIYLFWKWQTQADLEPNTSMTQGSKYKQKMAETTSI